MRYTGSIVVLAAVLGFSLASCDGSGTVATAAVSFPTNASIPVDIARPSGRRLPAADSGSATLEAQLFHGEMSVKVRLARGAPLEATEKASSSAADVRNLIEERDEPRKERSYGSLVLVCALAVLFVYL